MYIVSAFPGRLAPGAITTVSNTTYDQGKIVLQTVCIVMRTVQKWPGKSMPKYSDRATRGPRSKPICCDINIQTLNYSTHSIMHGSPPLLRKSATPSMKVPLKKLPLLALRNNKCQEYLIYNHKSRKRSVCIV